jgi:2-polyprenyl-6-methoxyphenol hydroxylase-like FAD-dependent oxidoreductase
MQSVQHLTDALHHALQARKDGALDERDFYMRLLELSASLITLLQDELANRQIVMADG